ncbi:MAG TPA: protein kinase, partial [Pyrinomonadaceae bacterium]|nr:protein kinase [Pyrinomonadaceae bacterium]
MDNLIDLFHAALALAPSERAAYLQKVCGADVSLRKTVESLIEHHEQTDNFIDLPAYQAAAQLLTNSENFAAGQMIAHYQILSVLGEGGMGKVFLAEDTKLKRKVALKVLPSLTTNDPAARQRLLREARAAARLDHPNICAIYEVGENDGHSYIAMQYIEGQTLYARMKLGRLSCDDALKIAAQVADALAEAHSHNLIHRDIKPANVMLTNRDQVKVLDFGLAKTVDQNLATIEERETEILLTQPGIIVGTVPYMSPEQIRADKVDARTDIWSLGVILYEMITNQKPFEGDTGEDIRASILKEEMPQISIEVPDRLRWIVEKALRKNREQRYQTTNEMLFDLHDLQTQAVASDVISRRSASPGSSAEMGFTLRGGEATISGPAADTSKITNANEGSSLRRQIKEHKRLSASLLIAFALTAAVLAFGLYQQRTSRVKPAAPLQTMKMTRLTTTGKAPDAAISPDRKYLAYVKDENAQESLWLQQISIPGSGVQLLPPSGRVLLGLRFSDDGKYIYYEADENAQVVELFRLPLLGGITQKLITDIDSVATFSPDGRQLAFLRGYPLRRETALLLANADGSGERALATHGWVNGFPTSGGTAAWSPDGSVIVCPVKGTDAHGRYATLLAVRVADGTEKSISSQRFWQVGTIAWLRDGSGLVFTARERMAAPSQIWYLSYPAGVARRITNEINDYLAVSITADSASVVAVVSDQVSNIWIAPYDDARRANQITSNRVDGATGMAWTPDGQIVYASRTSGNLDLWIVAADGTGQKQLTADAGNNNRPSVSADGRYVVFVSDRTGARHLWRIDM